MFNPSTTTHGIAKGDRVRCTKSYSRSNLYKHLGVVGSEGEVTEAVGFDHIKVRFDGADTSVSVSSNRFEKITPPAVAGKQWVIILVENGVLKPATNPRQYTSEKQAHAVAREMAEKNPGNAFVIFEATGFTFIPKVVTTEVFKL